MNFTKTMVDVVFELRRLKTHNYSQFLRLADPNIAHLLIELYYDTDDKKARNLVALFMHEAGAKWVALLQNSDPNSAPMRNSDDEADNIVRLASG